jgi:hypothetical protein
MCEPDVFLPIPTFHVELLTNAEDDGNGMDDDSCEQLPHPARRFF